MIFVNAGSTPCWRLSCSFVVEGPGTVRGRRRMDADRLDPGGSCHCDLTVQATARGEFVFTGRNCSYRGPSPQRMAAWNLRLLAEAAQGAEPGRPRLAISLARSALLTGQWGELSGTVSNVGADPIREVRVTASGELKVGPIWSISPDQLLAPGDSIPFRLSVTPLRGGERVPITLQADFKAGWEQRSMQQVFHCVVIESPAGGQIAVEHMEIVGRKDEMHIGGDAVITGRAQRATYPRVTGEVVGEAADTGPPPLCPDCGASTVADYMFCYRCGRPLAQR